MDVVLEIADAFIFDPLYAKLLPAYPAAFAGNATLSSIREEPTAYTRPHATWQYEPATQFFSTTPSKYAYMSQWTRDDWRRQALSLYLITWYAHALFLHLENVHSLLTLPIPGSSVS
jgi:lathosterol oxidase